MERNGEYEDKQCQNGRSIKKEKNKRKKEKEKREKSLED